MTAISAPHSASQSARRYRSDVKAANSCTGGSARLAETAMKWLLAPTSMPAVFRFAWDNSAGRRPRSAVAWLAGFALLWRVFIIVPLQHRSVGASPEGVTESSHSLERDRPDWRVTNDPAVRLPDHALYRATGTSVFSVLVRTTRLVKSLH